MPEGSRQNLARFCRRAKQTDASARRRPERTSATQVLKSLLSRLQGLHPSRPASRPSSTTEPVVAEKQAPKKRSPPRERERYALRTDVILRARGGWVELDLDIGRCPSRRRAPPVPFDPAQPLVAAFVCTARHRGVDIAAFADVLALEGHHGEPLPRDTTLARALQCEGAGADGTVFVTFRTNNVDRRKHFPSYGEVRAREAKEQIGVAL